jgi:hypothetical protein
MPKSVMTRSCILKHLKFKYISFKDKLATNVKNYFKKSKWEDIMLEQVIDIVEMYPTNALSYLHEKR